MIQYLLCFDVSCLACFEKFWENGIASHWETCHKMSTWEFKSSNASAIAAPYVYDTCLKLEWASQLLFASSSPVFTGSKHTHILYLYIYVWLRSLYIPWNPFSSSSANPFLEFYWCSNPHPSHQPINSFNRALIAFTATPVSSAITPTPLHHSWLRAGGLGLPSWPNIGFTNKKEQNRKYREDMERFVSESASRKGLNHRAPSFSVIKLKCPETLKLGLIQQRMKVDVKLQNIVGNILSDLVKPCEAPFDISMANWNKKR